MSGFSTSDRLALVGILVAAAAVVVGLLATRRWGTRRRLIAFDCVSTPLISEAHLGALGRDLLKVTYRDVEVVNPHLVHIRIRNIGPSDVASVHFDAETPLTVGLSCRVLGVTTVPGPVPAGVSSTGAQGEITFGPGLLRRNEEWALGVLVEGSPRPEMMSSLIDTDIVRRG
ncbi:hypothetical protein AB0J82_09190 [Asanoa sp. NPDC049518]|uniref:hypothetical protein n=1 Tax=unclassified Asanoa TaxID=2685164 RepID=UPI0034373B98